MPFTVPRSSVKLPTLTAFVPLFVIDTVPLDKLAATVLMTFDALVNA